jgi:hypothetical protein
VIPEPQQVHRQHLPGVDPLRLNQHADLLPHPFAVEEGHGLPAELGAGVLEVVEEAAGGEPEGLTGQGNGREAGGLAGKNQGGEVDVGGQVLLPDQDEGVAVYPLAAVGGEGAVAADASVEEARPFEAVIAGDEEPAVEPPGKLAVERSPSRRDVRHLTRFQGDVRIPQKRRKR